MAISVSEIGGGWRLLYQSGIDQYQPNTALFLRNPMPISFSAASTRRRSARHSCVVPARAVDPQTGDQNSDSSTQEDLWYVGKLAVGSIAGGAVIKYGSALFPEITTPNIVVALIIITTPVIVAVLLLIKESRPKPE